MWAGRNASVANVYPGESVEGKDIRITEDIISTGDGMRDIARERKRSKARRVFLAASFPLFTEGLTKFEQAYKDGLFDLLMGTNLTWLNPELKNKPWFKTVDMSKYVALLIATLNHDSSISALLDPGERIKNLLAAHNKSQGRNPCGI